MSRELSASTTLHRAVAITLALFAIPSVAQLNENCTVSIWIRFSQTDNRLLKGDSDIVRRNEHVNT